MESMFYCCKAIESLPDISLWDTEKVINMKQMFGGCNKLKSLPNISFWNTKNVTDMSEMFLLVQFIKIFTRYFEMGYKECY